MGERTSWYRGPVGTEHQRNSENKGPVIQRIRGTVVPEDRRNNGPRGAEDQRNSGPRGSEEK